MATDASSSKTYIYNFQIMTKHNLDVRSYVFLIFRAFSEYDSEKIRLIYFDYIKNPR